MNRFGAQAQRAWQEHAPTRYENLEDPERFFTDLGVQVEAQMSQLLVDLRRNIPQNLPYLERVAQLRAAQMQAEELAMQNLVWEGFEDVMEPDLSSEDLLGRLPTVEMIEDRRWRVRDRAETLAECEGETEPMYLDQDLEELEMLAQVEKAVTALQAEEPLTAEMSAAVQLYLSGQ